LDGLLLHTHTLCIIRYEETNPQDGGAPAEETKRSLSPAVLPDMATGTTAWRHYRPVLPPTTEGPGAAKMLSVTGGTTGPASGTTGPRYYRHQQKTPAQVPGRQAVLPGQEPVLPHDRYYRSRQAVLPTATETFRVMSAQRLVTLSIFRYLFLKYPCLCGWPINIPHPPL
jgi:hypothetical protein